MWKAFINRCIVKITNFIIQSKEVATTESITIAELNENNELLIPERFFKANSAQNSSIIITTNHSDIVSYIRFIVLLNAKLESEKEFDPFTLLSLESTQVLFNKFLLNQDAFYIDEVVAISSFKTGVSLLITNMKKYYATGVSDSRKRVTAMFLKQLNNTIIELVKVSVK
jgi:hypothetical protein